MPYNPYQPHNDLPSLPPAGVELESKPVLKQAIAASRALAQLKGAGDLIPNQAALVRLIGLREAQFSSQIENVVTTSDELYRAFSDEAHRTDAQTKEVLHYNDALWHGYGQLKEGRPLGTRLFEEMVGIIKGSQVGVRKVPGVKIATASGDVLYTPPEGQGVIRQKLAELELFLHEQEGLDPLVKLAAIHYQFEAIHPFTDGNGRTGRILNILYLVSEGLLDLPVLYLSQYILANRSAYYEGLRRVTEAGEWESWILYMLKGVEETAQETYNRILAIRNLMEETAQEVKEKLHKIYSRDLIEVLFTQAYCKIRFLEQAGLGNRQTASKYLQALEGIGLLSRVAVGREAYYLNHRFLDLLRQ